MSRALEEQRDFLLGALRELEADHDAGVVDDADYESLKDDYTVRAANVLRALEAESAGQRRPQRPRSTGSTVGVLVAAGVGVLLLVLAVSFSARQREEGQSLTGGDSIGGAAAMSTTVLDPQVAQLLRQAQQLFSAGEYAAAIKVYDQVLTIDADEVEALTYRGWLLRLVAVQATGDDRTLLQDRARQSLDRALELEPTYADARVFRAILLGDLDQPAAALADLDALPPDGVPAGMQSMVDGLRADLEAALAQPGSTTGTPR